ncbi:TetR family transcriptional regulator [Advenella kashmirensis W13003]|uniref:TetR family transcriptional regulator n=1 Tax=Advenella kashmirensis W13003 TaxID=1424334 RepID=V8QSR0_9BURK|nr:TetR/AcrR family transcriptional regulator [Advenella kashmirensis]ETF02667.1 TetR family transcriptional regulator [Advenella kashmirensis W13003]
MTKPAQHQKKTPSRRSRKVNGPGRPEGASVVRDEILDAAEVIFSDKGYAGTPLREIAEQANVTQALISYYFGSKFGLFQAVFLRRSELVSQERLEALKALETQAAPKVSEIVRSFLEPVLSLRATFQGRAFLRLQARLHTEPSEISYSLRSEAYGGSTQRYVAVLRKALPKLNELDACWRVTFMIGTYLYAFSDSHRMDEMAPKGLYDVDDTEELINQVTRFMVGGLKAE